jgi:RsiW-degrading membrane proteinase PrsW (M82 family)
VGTVAILIGVLLAIAVGILPMLVYAAILWWFDRYEKEPLGLLVAAFLWGAIPSILFSLFAEIILDVPISAFVDPLAANLLGVAVVAPVVEELVKAFALVLLLIFFRREIDSPLDGIVYGGLVGFGFAAVENIFYFVGAFMESGLGGMAMLTVFRAFVFGLNHALFTGLTGLGFALVWTSPNILLKIAGPVVGLSAGILTHALHNGSVTLGAEWVWPCVIPFVSNGLGILFLLAVIVWASVREQRAIATFLDEEVDLGTLSQEDYEIVSSYLKRVGVRSAALFGGDFRRWAHLGRYYRLATELAFNKDRQSRFPQDQALESRIAALRSQVLDLSQE